MREIIIGAQGFVGSNLSRHLPNAIKTSRRNGSEVPDSGYWFFDMLDSNPALPNASVAYICAGVNGTLTCARDPQGSFRANVDGTIRIARLYENDFVVWIGSTTAEWSSDHYGRQKLITETVLRTMPNVAIVRAGRVTKDNVDDLCRLMILLGRDRQGGTRLWNVDEKPYVK
jgi:dTDP-4-dehydrorhamnose reductase